MSQLVAVRDETIGKSDISILGHLKSLLAFHLSWGETLRAFFDNKCLNSVTVIFITSPNNNVPQSGISDPSLFSVQNVSTIDFLGRGLQSGGVATIIRLGQSKAENFIKVHTFSKQSLFLFIVAESIDYSHSNSVMN